MQTRYAPSRFDENRPVEVSSAVQFLSKPRVRKTSHVSSKYQAAYVVSRYLYEIFYLHLLSNTVQELTLRSHSHDDRHGTIVITTVDVRYVVFLKLLFL